MGLEVYYPTDIRNALLAAEQAASVTAEATGNQDTPFAAGYLIGYRAALVTIALAFGLGLARPDLTWEVVTNDYPTTLQGFGV